MKSLFGGAYSDRRVLVTGHTGFKGSWLSLWLQDMGSNVSGVALPPATKPNHFELLNLDLDSHIRDINDAQAMITIFQEVQPEVVFHLAAQPLVRYSYLQPTETIRTNVMGLVNVLEACRQTASVEAIVVVTSDKCYQNLEWAWPYRETDALGGHDPYSASKAAADIIAHGYRLSFFSQERPNLATARGGNVIGGGDWSEDRLFPDLFLAAYSDTELRLRNPKATRPWQHVLDCLSGYLLLGCALLEDRTAAEGAWNFGPGPEGNRPVDMVVAEAARHWPRLTWTTGSSENQPHEAALLQLDSSLARRQLRWEPVWDWQQAVQATVRWQQAYTEGQILSPDQLRSYVEEAGRLGRPWSCQCG